MVLGQHLEVRKWVQNGRCLSRTSYANMVDENHPTGRTIRRTRSQERAEESRQRKLNQVHIEGKNAKRQANLKCIVEGHTFFGGDRSIGHGGIILVLSF